MVDKKLRVASFQFSISRKIDENLNTILKAIESASKKEVRLLLTQECALCGYPPVELTAISELDFNELSRAQKIVREAAKKHHMYIALGTITREDGETYNSILMINDKGCIEGVYNKRALWGWDCDNFERGNELGIYEIDGIKVGTRICYEVRFPEYFRELYMNNVDLCLISFTDIGSEVDKDKRDIIKSHLVTRAVENVMHVLSSNSMSTYQLAPSCLISPDGMVVEQSDYNKEMLLVGDIVVDRSTFGRRGRLTNSDYIIDKAL